VPEHVSIEIFNVGRTVVDRAEVRRWLDHVGADGYEVPGPDAATDPALLIALAAKRCYMSFEPGLNPNVTRVRSDLVAYLDNILASRHGSVLEHSVYTFAIEGVSRVFTAEMNRHRAGWAISEGSLRFIRFDRDIPYWVPTSLTESTSDDPDLADRKAASRAVFDAAFETTEHYYAELLKIWEMDSADKNFDYKKRVTSCLRRIVPLGVATGGVWTGNVRALRHVIALRTEPAAEEEIFHVFSRIAEMMLAAEPALFSDLERTEAGGFAPRYRKV
jgi:thymidylate synthase (FAD)